MDNQQFQIPAEAVADSKIAMARHNLLIMIGFTLVNIVLLLLGSNTFMLFSATVPYYAFLFGHWYGIPVLYVIAVLPMIAYLLCWLLSKKHFGWMIAALVLFSIDTIGLVLISLLYADISGIFDLVIHVVVLYYLIVGVKYGYQKNRLARESSSWQF